MPYIEHKLKKDKSIMELGRTLLAPKLDVLDKFTTFAPEQFYGQEGFKETVTVPGALPAREYGWRNDRSEPIKTDVYEETTVDMTVEGPSNLYSSVKVSDEQKEYDLEGSFGRLTDAQTTALADKINARARGQIMDAPYEISIAADVRRDKILEDAEIGQDTWFNAFVQAGRRLNQLGVPSTSRTALVGSAVAASLQQSQKLTKVRGNNDDQAFSTANIGVYAGFNIVEDTANLVDPDEALVFDSSGFLFWSFAPQIPEGAVRGARTNVGGIGLRWLVDYDHGYQVDRSTWSGWSSFNYAKDFVQGFDTEGMRVHGVNPYFVRGAKIVFKDGTGGFLPGDNGADTNGRQGASADSELGRYFNGQPLKTGSTPTGNWYPSVLEGSVQIPGGEAGDGETGGEDDGEETP